MDRDKQTKILKALAAIAILVWVWDGGRNYGKNRVEESVSYRIGTHIFQQYAMRCITNPPRPKEEFQRCIEALGDSLLDQYQIERN